MWKEIFKFVCIYACFTIGNAVSDLTIKSNYFLMYQTIFESNNCMFDFHSDTMTRCEMTLSNNTLGFECTLDLDYPKECTLLKGSFSLDEEAMTVFYCLQKYTGTYIHSMDCDRKMSLQDYYSRIFKNCYMENITHFLKVSDSRLDPECGNFIDTRLTNLKQISVFLYDECIPLNKYLQNFKYLNKLNFYMQYNKNFLECKDYHLTNLPQINEVVINVIRDREIDIKLSIFLNKILQSMENLEVLEIHFLKIVGNCEIESNFFNGFKKLTSLTFKNCNIVELSKDNFNDSVNLRSLAFLDGFIYDFDWLRSPIIQNNLTFLELDKEINITEPTMTAFICQDFYICRFNVDKNKKSCPKGCGCFWNRIDYRFEIHCDKADIGMEIPEVPIVSNASLYINKKNLTQLANSTLYGYSNIRQLHLANNKLSTINVDQLPPNLTYLDLRNNSLQSFDDKVLKFLSSRGDIFSMELSGNPFKYNCDTLNMLQFFLKFSNYIKDFDELKWHKKKIEISMALRLAADCKPKALLYYALGPLFGFTLLIIIYFYFKNFIFMWLYERNLCLFWISRPEPKDVIVLKIDAFLAFCHKDLDLVDEYVEKLEKGSREYELCYYHRDWLIGEPIPNLILKTIECSKRIIILMTNNFINSSWGLFEFRSSIQAASMNKDKRLIVILYPEVEIDKLDSELKIYMKYNTYLKRDDPLFWRKLMFSMPHKQIHCEQPTLKEGPSIEDNQL